MEPEEIDKLYKERLGRMAPTPPADLWNRLQDRMAEEMPQAAPVPLHEEKRRFGFLYYSIAAAVTLLLAVGVVLKFNQPQPATNHTMAHTNVAPGAEQPAATIVAPEATPEQTIAAVTPDETIAEPTIAQTPTKVSETPAPAKTRRAIPAKPARKTEERWVKVDPKPATMLARQTPVTEAPEMTPQQQTVAQHTPVSFASAGSAEPVEIIIKRTVSQEHVAIAAADEPAEEATSFQRKQKLAKSIFKQVKNISNGEKVDLSEIGLSADRIALETKIGKQKISKVINL